MKKRKENNPWTWRLVWLVALLFGLLVASVCTGCSPRIIEHTTIEYRDTTIYRESVRDTTIYVPLPVESGMAIVPVGDTSRVETSLAESTAFVDSIGLLRHSIRNKEKPLPVVVPVRSVYVYSGASHTEAQVLTKIEYRDKPLSWWQSLKIGAFPWLIMAVVLLLIWTFRKSIFKLIAL